MAASTRQYCFRWYTCRRASMVVWAGIGGFGAFVVLAALSVATIAVLHMT